MITVFTERQREVHGPYRSYEINSKLTFRKAAQADGVDYRSTDVNLCEF